MESMSVSHLSYPNSLQKWLNGTLAFCILGSLACSFVMCSFFFFFFWGGGGGGVLSKLAFLLRRSCIIEFIKRVAETSLIHSIIQEHEC